MKAALLEGGLTEIQCRKMHGLSFPYAFYLEKLLHSKRLSSLLSPVIELFFFLLPIRNKILVIAKKY